MTTTGHTVFAMFYWLCKYSVTTLCNVFYLPFVVVVFVVVVTVVVLRVWFLLFSFVVFSFGVGD